MVIVVWAPATLDDRRAIAAAVSAADFIFTRLLSGKCGSWLRKIHRIRLVSLFVTPT
jgi:hypothetical protein